LRDAELGDGPDLPGLQLADRLLVLSVQEEQLTDPLVLATRAVPRVALRKERARQHAEVRQTADERVGRGLEDPDEERARGIGRDLDLVIGFRLAGADRRLVGRRRQIANESIEQPAETDALDRAADEHRRED